MKEQDHESEMKMREVHGMKSGQLTLGGHKDCAKPSWNALWPTSEVFRELAL